MKAPKTVDEYLDRLEGNFAYPVLTRVRELIHEVVPAVEEKIKWGAPSFEYKGLMLSMVAFKTKAAVWFQKGALLDDPQNLLRASSEETKSMRKYELVSLDDLNEEAFRALLSEAVEKQNSGEKVKGFNEPVQKFKSSQLLEEALKKNPKAAFAFEGLPNYKKREYIEHIEGAKQQSTKERRLKKSIQLLEEGKGLHDKYR